MTTKEKTELVRLLHMYMASLIVDNDANIREARNHKDNRWAGNYKYGIKTQYEHARIIATKLAVEVGNEIKAVWEL